MSTLRETKKNTTSLVFKLSGPIERVSKRIDDESAERLSDRLHPAEAHCENGVCMVTWKPKRPAA
jgi:hypothetical protein